MGLDVCAYKNVVALGGPETDSDEVDADVRICYADPNNFPGRCDEFPDGTPMRAEASEHSVSLGYGTYNRWREQLAKLAGYPLTEGIGMLGVMERTHQYGAIVAGEGPFWELIWFPDNEGTIGTAVCKKLFEDFTKYADSAEAEGGTFYSFYCGFMNAFEFASENGVVDFC